MDKKEEESDIAKLRRGIEQEGIDRFTRIRRMALLRHLLSEKEEEKEKVKYNRGRNELDCSESIELGKEILSLIAKELRENEQLEIEQMRELDKLMRDNYYYLARYLFSYFLIAIEFGIDKEKQFYAPRDMVLGKIAKRLDVFYYKPKGILALNMPQGTGKEQPLSSKILTPNGWTTMVEIKIGDEVIGADGFPCKVTDIFPRGLKDVYRITFDDNTYVDCGLEHLWEVKTSDDRRRNKSARVVNTKQMLENYVLGKNSKRPYHNYSVRLVKPIEYYSKLTEDDLKPYLLGCLIGDGGLSRKTIKFTSADKEIIDRISVELPKTDKLVKYIGNYEYGISKKEDKRDENGYPVKPITCQKLYEYGLMMKTSEEKFIPKKYLYASVEERIDLLRGLMDTDGWTDKRNCNCEFTTVSEKLCFDMLELVRGLGGKASYTTKQGRYKNKDGEIIKCKKVYRINISIKINPFYLPRKAKQHSEPQFNYQKMIVNIEKVRQEECQCIMVDHKDHLYVTDGYTLTHNSETGKRFMAWVIGKEPGLPNMMVSYSAAIAKEKFYGGVQALIEDENGNYQKIFPKLRLLFKSAENMSLDYTDEANRKNPHSEYTLYCCGFDGGITGRTRAHNVLYLDDLVKNMEAANNKDVMDKMNDEFNATLRKRMQGNCKMLIIGTLFSINDPFSRTISFFREHAPERIEVLRLPGLNENNETNFPYKYGFELSTEQLLEDKALMDTVSFECLIQQNPIERFGILFSEEELSKFEIEPDERKERVIAAVDVAWGGGDSLAMPIGSEYKNGDVYITDVVCSKDGKEETIPLVARKIIENEVSECFFEANNGGDMFADAVQKELDEKNYKCYIHHGKAPTTKAKRDRILACCGEIKGNPVAKYRLKFKTRSACKNDRMYNDFLDLLTHYNEKLELQGKKQNPDDVPDACASLLTNVLGVQKKGIARSRVSREMLGI